jgi:hypothetical protein
MLEMGLGVFRLELERLLVAGDAFPGRRWREKTYPRLLKVWRARLRLDDLFEQADGSVFLGVAQLRRD